MSTQPLFLIMTIDIQELRGNRIAHTWHMEDWPAALNQLQGKK